MMNTWELTNLEQFEELAYEVGDSLLHDAPQVDVGSWQSQDISDRPEMISYELQHVMLKMLIGTPYQLKLAICTGANMPWAEDHFKERVSGIPHNPPPSERWWPYAQQGNSEHKLDEKFSHTYPERFWPKNAGTGLKEADMGMCYPIRGIRYDYGDLRDVVRMLIQTPATRQAYLPVWFPEDTGAREGQRVPCTLGYHFMIRHGYMDITYHIRSCDYMRHWRDDVYMAGRLLQWVCERVNEGSSGSVFARSLVMNIGSLHIFEGDRASLQVKLKATQKKINEAKYAKLASSL